MGEEAVSLVGRVFFKKSAAGASLSGCRLGQALTWQAPRCSPGPHAADFAAGTSQAVPAGAAPFRPGSSAGQAGLELGSSEGLPASNYLVEGVFR